MARLDIDAVLVTDLLTRFLRAEAADRGCGTAVVGLTGEVDSAVACALAAQALGPRSVLAVLTTDGTPSVAREVAAATGVRTKVVDVGAWVAGYIDAEALDGPRIAQLLARARQAALDDQASAERGFVIDASNKTALLLGDATLLAGGARAVNPLGDLYASQVVQLARHLMLPRSVIEASSGAGMETDGVLVRLVDERATAAELEAEGLDGGRLRQLGARVAASRAGRTPPVLAKLGPRTIERDLRD